MTLGFVCRLCRRVYPICWERPQMCYCGNHEWREAAPRDIKKSITDLENLLKKDAND